MDWMFHDRNPITGVVTHVKVEDGQVIYRRTQQVGAILDHAQALRSDETAWTEGKDAKHGINTALLPAALYEQFWHEFRGQNPQNKTLPPPRGLVGMHHPEFQQFVQRKLQSREYRGFMTTNKNPYPWRERQIFLPGAKPSVDNKL